MVQCSLTFSELSQHPKVVTLVCDDTHIVRLKAPVKNKLGLPLRIN